MDLFCRLFGGIFTAVAVFILVIFGAIVASGQIPLHISMLPMLITPAVFGIIGLTVFFAPTRRKKREHRLKNEGDHLIATISEVAQNSTVRVNGHYLWVIYATAMDPVTGEMRMFKSKGYSYNPTPLLLQTEVDVYIDPIRRERYMMDESSAMR